VKGQRLVCEWLLDEGGLGDQQDMGRGGNCRSSGFPVKMSHVRKRMHTKMRTEEEPGPMQPAAKKQST